MFVRILFCAFTRTKHTIVCMGSLLDTSAVCLYVLHNRAPQGALRNSLHWGPSLLSYATGSTYLFNACQHLRLFSWQKQLKNTSIKNKIKSANKSHLVVKKRLQHCTRRAACFISVSLVRTDWIEAVNGTSTLNEKTNGLFKWTIL